MVSAGKLDQPIRIERAVTAANDFGEPAIVGWALLAQVWAHVITAKGREIVAGGRDTETNVVAFRIRDGVEFTNADRIVWGGQVFNVIAVNPMPREGELMVEARQVEGASGA